ncbi:MAG: class A beta-lactamase-related serine hydrolase [Cytophagaceae bacterium]|nr:class A beta-lactamase-related serine hydrolase [Cytophagaceae bacterium]
MKKLLLALLLNSPVLAQNDPAFSLEALMRTRSAQFDAILAHPEIHEVQIIYTQIDRDRRNRPMFRTYRHGVDANRYFYPASTVKLPTALLALEKLNKLNIKGLDKYATMKTGAAYERQTPVERDSTAASGLPSVAQYVRKILMVSDNDAHNRLYEFLGQQYLNERLHQKGYANVRIVHRLQVGMTREQNRRTNPVKFLGKNGGVLYEQPLVTSEKEFVPAAPIKKGKGFMRGETLINEPFDFTYNNYFALEDQHEVLKALLFPEAVPAKKRFDLSPDDYRFVYKYMSQYPTESTSPVYPQPAYWPAYCKFLFLGSEKTATLPKTLRIFNKVGDAYGFLLDNAYVVDFEKGIEFMVTVVMHCNADGIYNDDKYDYDSVGFPFMKNLGQLLYDYEAKRVRARKPDLSKFILDYDDK